MVYIKDHTGIMVCVELKLVILVGFSRMFYLEMNELFGMMKYFVEK